MSLAAISQHDQIELGAYEELWLSNDKQSFKRLASIFGAGIFSPSQLVSEDVSRSRLAEVADILASQEIEDVQAIFRGEEEYPSCLSDARYPIQMFYARGSLDILSAPRRIAIVGSRQASEMGVIRAKYLAKKLVHDGVVVISGLARGIDTAALNSAINEGGSVIGVIGTPITDYYPRENEQLQKHIASAHLLISQVPILRYNRQNYLKNRIFFPERNVTMSALSQATVIVEASDTSGSLIQARAALKQKRKLFIMENCFHRNLHWPELYQKKGALRVSSYEEIKYEMGWQ